MTLYDIKGEFLRLYELATEDEDQQAFLDTLEGLKGELEVKASGYVQVIKQLEKETRANNVKSMKLALISAMDVAEVDSIPAGDYTLKIVKNGGLQPLKIDGDVPDNFTKVKIEPDNDLIRKALNDGEELSFAHLEPRGRHLNIK